MSRRPARRSAPAAALSPTAACPCGAGGGYADCCGALHAGRREAATATELMRSRYSAFAVRDAAYLLRSWHSGTRPAEVAFDPGVRWVGLDILGTTGGTAFHPEGTVDFRARYRQGGSEGEQRENSRFLREDGRWVYAGEADR